MAYQPNVQWIIPPGLAPMIAQFEAHCRIALEEKANVLIIGDTGIGKELFLRIYEKAYREANPNIEIIIDFSKEDFKRPYSLEKLCRALKDDSYWNFSLNSPENTIERINELLAKPTILDKVLEKYSDFIFSPDIMYLGEQTERFKTGYSSEINAPRIQNRIKKMNRLILETLYPTLVPKMGRAHPVEKINCAHFREALAASELFGHERGAFTGAMKRTIGWIEKAHNGMLELDEIGTLSEDVQSQLLTFIESGKYHRVGGTQLLHADVNIIAATNDPDMLRPDFYQRFFHFFIPPLYKRRSDILYYMAFQHPEIIPSLRPSETLSLLAHNWPGNVREVNTTALLLKRNRLTNESSEETTGEAIIEAFGGTMMALNTEESLVSASKPFFLFEDLKEKGVNVGRLERLLNSLKVGLNIRSKKNPYKDFKKTMLIQDEEKSEKYDAVWLDQYADFELAYFGLEIYCDLFFQDGNSKDNLLDQKEYKHNLSFDESEIDDEKISAFIRAGLPELRVSILQYLLNISEGELKHASDEIAASINSKNKPARISVLKMLSDKFPDNVFLNKLFSKEYKKHKTGTEDILSLRHADLLKRYYRQNLIKHNWKVKPTAEAIDLPTSTLRDQIKKLNIHED